MAYFVFSVTGRRSGPAEEKARALAGIHFVQTGVKAKTAYIPSGKMMGPGYAVTTKTVSQDQLARWADQVSHRAAQPRQRRRRVRM